MDLSAERVAALTAFMERTHLTQCSLEWLNLALTHPSYAGELSEEGAPHNQRLEYLGDAVVGLAVSDYLFQHYPAWAEGEMTRVKSWVVSSYCLCQISRRLQVGEVLLLGRGEEASGGRGRASILADTFEAVAAAVYLHAGFPAAAEWLNGILGPKIDEIARHGFRLDHKSRLQEVVQQYLCVTPSYAVVAETGPDHHKVFTAEVRARPLRLGCGQGRSKKEAEQAAAEDALRLMLDEEGRFFPDAIEGLRETFPGLDPVRSEEE